RRKRSGPPLAPRASESVFTSTTWTPAPMASASVFTSTTWSDDARSLLPRDHRRMLTRAVRARFLVVVTGFLGFVLFIEWWQELDRKKREEKVCWQWSASCSRSRQ